MLGKEERKTSFFDTDFVCAHLIDKKSFYAKMHDLADKVITGDDFADIYCLNNGRPSVPPARITKVLILETYEDFSDREALEMMRFNIKWKYALDVNQEDIDAELKEAANLLAKIVSQDIEKDKENKPKIKRGVAKDRIISTTDPEMRHGKKSRSGKFNGYKTHLTKDTSSEIITNIEVSAGNCPD